MKNKKALSLLIFLCLLLSLCSCKKAEKETNEMILSPSVTASVEPTAEPQPTLATPIPTPSPTIEETPLPTAAPVVQAEMTYRSGVDLEAGSYYLQSTGGESSYEIQDIHGTLLSDGNFSTNCYVDLMDERTLIVKNAAVLPASEAPQAQAEQDGSYAQGHYLVGRDIPAGKYEITSSGIEQPICREMTGANNVASNILRKWDASTPVVIEAREGEYIQLRNCTAVSTSKELTPLSYAIDTSSAEAPAEETQPKPDPTPVEEEDDEGYTVYITDTGEKYHSGGCRYLKKSKHAIGIARAKSSGYTACSRCSP